MQQIKAGLEAAGVTTWFDMDRLEVGDDYDRKIQRNIARCSYFIPVVSADHPAPPSKAISGANGATRSTGRATWPTARSSSCRSASTTPIAADALVPDRFKSLHFTRLPGGEVPPEFAERLKRLHCGRRRHERYERRARPIRRRRRSTIAIPGSGSPRSPRRRAPTSTAARRRSPNSPGACSASCSPCCSASRASARPRFCGPASCRGCAPRAIARCTCASTTAATPPSRPSRSSWRSAAPRATAESGPRPAWPSPARSLWEFLHHRDDVLRDEAGDDADPAADLRPVRGDLHRSRRRDEFGRARAARFLDELADLVENRPPKALEARLDADESAAERFDFARSDYRVLIALREDYLAPLEGLKKAMPSITQNRLRLAPMTGTQALAAVLQPGQGTGHRGGGRGDRALRRRRRRARQRRGRAVAASASSAASSTTRASRRAAARSRSTCWPARTPPFSAISTSARSPISRRRCAGSSRTSC